MQLMRDDTLANNWPVAGGRRRTHCSPAGRATPSTYHRLVVRTGHALANGQQIHRESGPIEVTALTTGIALLVNVEGHRIQGAAGWRTLRGCRCVRDKGRQKEPKWQIGHQLARARPWHCSLAACVAAGNAELRNDPTLIRSSCRTRLLLVDIGTIRCAFHQ